ncbi:glucokinase [Sphingomonas sp. URHD0057]|uniref:glucokinase n=1 Tax=Sphingomonas sp. URHD0057 TaxID=1380389 RepID=UPI00048D98AE|nr:glucokinase [Sphingomonas sp. URHD0057]
MTKPANRIVSADIGGTHARFAIATIDAERIELGEPVTLRTADHVSFESAWNEFERQSGTALPRELSIAIAGPVDDAELSLTNSQWRFNRDRMVEELGLHSITLLNDFGAVAHAVATVGEAALLHIAGPDEPLPERGVVTVVGPGTGLGAAALLRRSKDEYEILETEAGHMDFSPLDALEDQIVKELRKTFRRVSVERLVSGPGLRNIYDVLALVEGEAAGIRGETELWTAALALTDSLATLALERFCMCFGAVAGDFALAHGASAVVIGGGIGKRLKDYLPGSGFADRFAAKGRFSSRLAAMPVKLITHPEPGLLGAAAAYVQKSRASQ